MPFPKSRYATVRISKPAALSPVSPENDRAAWLDRRLTFVEGVAPFEVTMERGAENAAQVISLCIQRVAVLNSSRNKSAKNLFFL
jgi:hypothetical protein